MPMVTQFDNKVVLITGGGAGIGRAAARQFAAGGARVVVSGRRDSTLQALSHENTLIDYIVADAANPDDAASRNSR